jgi:hypothetical protein
MYWLALFCICFSNVAYLIPAIFYFSNYRLVYGTIFIFIMICSFFFHLCEFPFYCILSEFTHTILDYTLANGIITRLACIFAGLHGETEYMFLVINMMYVAIIGSLMYTHIDAATIAWNFTFCFSILLIGLCSKVDNVPRLIAIFAMKRLWSFLLGISFALLGLICKQIGSVLSLHNYYYIHSLWHIYTALGAFFVEYSIVNEEKIMPKPIIY